MVWSPAWAGLPPARRDSFRWSAGCGAGDASVLTEQNYFDFTNQPTGIFTYTFLYLLREFSCVFIGLSMQDENIRRLLHYSKKERIEAYEKEGKEKEEIPEDKWLRHYAVLPRSNKPRVDEAREETLRLLGTSVLWVDADFKELPDKIKGIYQATGDKWDAVF